MHQHPHAAQHAELHQLLELPVDLGQGAWHAVAAAHRDRGSLDPLAVQSGQDLPLFHGDTQSGLGGEVASGRGQRDAAAGLVGSHHDVEQTGGPVFGAAGQEERMVLRIGPGGGQDNFRFRQALGTAGCRDLLPDAFGFGAEDRLQIIVERVLEQGLPQALHRREALLGDRRGGGGGEAQDGGSRLRAAAVAVGAVGPVDPDPGVAAADQELLDRGGDRGGAAKDLPGRAQHGGGRRRYALGGTVQQAGETGQSGLIVRGRQVRQGRDRLGEEPVAAFQRIGKLVTSGAPLGIGEAVQIEPGCPGAEPEGGCPEAVVEVGGERRGDGELEGMAQQHAGGRRDRQMAGLKPHDTGGVDLEGRRQGVVGQDRQSAGQRPQVRPQQDRLDRAAVWLVDGLIDARRRAGRKWSGARSAVPADASAPCGLAWWRCRSALTAGSPSSGRGRRGRSPASDPRVLHGTCRAPPRHRPGGRSLRSGFGGW